MTCMIKCPKELFKVEVCIRIYFSTKSFEFENCNKRKWNFLPLLKLLFKVVKITILWYDKYYAVRLSYLKLNWIGSQLATNYPCLFHSIWNVCLLLVQYLYTVVILMIVKYWSSKCTPNQVLEGAKNLWVMTLKSVLKWR